LLERTFIWPSSIAAAVAWGENVPFDAAIVLLDADDFRDMLSLA
jgi:hypothetical protein